MVASRVVRVQACVPLGDLAPAPAELSRRAEASMARAMAAALTDFEMPSAAAVLSRLRQAFPLAPAGARIAALGIVMEQNRRPD